MGLRPFFWGQSMRSRSNSRGEMNHRPTSTPLRRVVRLGLGSAAFAGAGAMYATRAWPDLSVVSTVATSLMVVETGRMLPRIILSRSAAAIGRDAASRKPESSCALLAELTSMYSCELRSNVTRELPNRNAQSTLRVPTTPASCDDTGSWR